MKHIQNSPSQDSPAHNRPGRRAPERRAPLRTGNGPGFFRQSVSGPGGVSGRGRINNLRRAKIRPFAVFPKKEAADRTSADRRRAALLPAAPQAATAAALFAATVLLSLAPSLQPAEAKIWAAGPGVSFFQLKARTDALGKAHKTYARHYAELLARRANGFHLREKIKKAQTAYLSGSGSKPLFLETANLAFQADWNQEQRRILLYAFLRLAQLEPEPDEKKAFLISAGRFIMEPLSPSYPEYNLFPPPLIKELNRLQEGQNSFLMDWRKIFPHYEILLVNGKKIMRPKTRLNEGKYRIAALSSSRAPFIKTESLSGLLSNAPYQTAFLTTGPCRSAEIKPEWRKAAGKRRKDFRLLRNCPEPYAFDADRPQMKSQQTKETLPSSAPSQGRALWTAAPSSFPSARRAPQAPREFAYNNKSGAQISGGGGLETGAVRTSAVPTGADRESWTTATPDRIAADRISADRISADRIAAARLATDRRRAAELPSRAAAETAIIGNESDFSAMTGQNAGFSIPIDKNMTELAGERKTFPKWLAAGGALAAIGILIALSRPDHSEAPLQKSKIFY